MLVGDCTTDLHHTRHAEGVRVAFGRDNLFRRRAVYWWRRRLPSALSTALRRTEIVRSLRTREPTLARRRARACSVEFDRAMMRLMVAKRIPTRQELAEIVDELFRRVLDDGERTRSVRPSGPPPWTPDPQSDPRYDDLEPTEWHKVPYPPEQWQEEWQRAVMLNTQEDVADLVVDALDRREFDMPRDGPEWRLLCRLALITAAKAHGINARREWGDYSDGWPDRAEVPDRLLPGLPGADGIQPTRPSAPATAITASATVYKVPFFSESFRAFADDRGVGVDEVRGTAWTTNTTRQANIALEKFVSLMGDLPVDRITSETAEKFRAKLREMPNLFGRSIYAGQSAEQALTKARRLRRDIAADPERVMVGGKKVLPVQAMRWAEAVTLKTINRDLTFFTAWGKWMAKSPVRKRQLHEGISPFTGLLFTKRELKIHARSRGPKRTVFTREQIAALLSAPLMQSPPPFAARADTRAEF